MKHYLFTILTRDGEHEYYDKWLCTVHKKTVLSALDIIVEFTGTHKEDWEEPYPCVYESTYDYRHYSIYSREEVEPEDVKVLERYGI